MKKIKNEFNDPKRHDEKGLIILEPNKLISLNFNDYPLIWRGSISGHSITIVQKNSSNLLSSYDFGNFPMDYDHMKNKIINNIDEYISEHMG